MLKLLVLTDLHLTANGAEIIGLDPVRRFDAALAHAMSDHGDADLLILAGDLAHHAEPAAYATLSRRLRRCPIPIALIPGNHDRRQPMAAAFPEHMADDGFFHRVIDAGDIRLILLDTLDEAAPDLHSGHLCDARMAWLEQALDTPQRKIIVCHHPLAMTGFDGMDAIGLRNAGAVLQLLKKNNVEIVVSGHIHRTVSGVAGGLPFAIVKSSCHQMPLLLGPAGSDVSSDEPGGYGVALIHAGGVTIHTADFCAAPLIATDPASQAPT